MRETNKSLRRAAAQRGKDVDKLTASVLNKSMTRQISRDVEEEEDFLNEVRDPSNVCCFSKRRRRKIKESKFGELYGAGLKSPSPSVRSVPGSAFRESHCNESDGNRTPLELNVSANDSRANLHAEERDLTTGPVRPDNDSGT